ncbi:hypothetical protein JY545_24910, partial [Serratia marcescens]|nr:hypothetical protein [Serratia marcescens]
VVVFDYLFGNAILKRCNYTRGLPWLLSKQELREIKKMRLNAGMKSAALSLVVPIKILLAIWHTALVRRLTTLRLPFAQRGNNLKG